VVGLCRQAATMIYFGARTHKCKTGNLAVPRFCFSVSRGNAEGSYSGAHRKSGV